MAVEHSLEITDACSSDDGKLRRGTIWTCVAHIITGVIGSGVLSLAWSTAQLGWIAGPLTMLCFAFVTVISAFLLSDCYRSPHPLTGTRNRTLMDAVRVTLGRKHTWFCGFLQYVGLFGTSSAYVLTTATCVRAIQRSNCYHEKGQTAPCSGRESFFMLMFGLVQVLFSQIPGLHNMQWLSVVAASMSFTYASIGFGLGLAKVIGNGMIKGTIGGAPAPSTAQKLWRISQAIGDIAFAYPYSVILIEVQDTLKSPPPENQTMKRVSTLAVVITTFFYLCCGCFGYAAFGDDTPGNLLTGFGFYEPYWLVDFANACIILHLVGSYQVFSQLIFAFVEKWFVEKFPTSGLLNDVHVPLRPACRIKLFRVCFRTLYVASSTGLALAFPYFNQFLALLGAFSFWPLTVYLPVEMYFVQRKVARWSSKWLVLQVFSVGCLLVSMLALVGSIEGMFNQKLK